MIPWLLVALAALVAICGVLWALWRGAAKSAAHSASEAKAAQEALRTEQGRHATTQKRLDGCRQRLIDLAKLHDQHVADLKRVHADHMTEALAAAEAKARLVVDPDDLAAAAAAMNERESSR